MRYEANPRHAEQLQRDMADLRWGNLAGGSDMGSGLVCPGFKREPGAEEEAVPLDPGPALKFRALAARANYLCLDRPDIGFAAKEC